MVKLPRKIKASGFLALFGLLTALTGCDTVDMAPMHSSAQLTEITDPNQKLFASPQDAVDALVEATRQDNKEKLLKILGAKGKSLISSGDKVADNQARSRFLIAYDQKHGLENSDDAHAVLVVGEEEWPMPIPLVNSAKGWWFDTASGEQEILNRRIGKNELNVVETCRAFVEAEKEFASISPTHSYSARFHSHDSKHDGLYWPTANGEPESPLGSLIADATNEGYSDKALSKHNPYHGYFYKILTRQGEHAPGGAKNYFKNGRMTNGFALLAYPARYGDSGVMSFIVNQNGIVYERNLGTHTAEQTHHITEFDPDDTWNIIP